MCQKPRNPRLDSPRQHFLNLIVDVHFCRDPEYVVEFFEGDCFSCPGDEEPDEKSGESVETSVFVIRCFFFFSEIGCICSG